LNHKDRSHVPVGTGVSSGHIVILTRRYKQDARKLDALVTALNDFGGNSAENDHDDKQCFGDFDGHITIFGSGGCNTVLGNFAPTTRCTKYDPEIEVGIGQDPACPINKKLDELARQNSVQAVFLNEKSYGSMTECTNLDHTLRFLGYFEFIESRYVVGEEQEDVCTELGYIPTSAEWSNLTFRLHSHLRVEARPFLKTINEVESLVHDKTRPYQSIILDHNDHTDIIYHCFKSDGDNTRDCLNLNHTISIRDVIDQLILSGEIQKHIASAGGRNFWQHDTLGRNIGMVSREMDVTMAGTELLKFEQEETQDSTSGYDAHGDNQQTKNSSDADDSDYQPESEANEPESEADDFEDSGDSPEEYAAEETGLDDIGYQSDFNSDYEFETVENALILEETLPYGQSPPVSIPYEGTGATIPKIVSCCVFVSAACAMKHNKQCLREIGSIVCASPMDEISLGVTLRTRPTPSCNRNLDVNLCYLRHSFRQHDVLLPTIRAKTRCMVTEIPIPTLEDMIFQIIVLRFTGRVYRYEQYQRYYNAMNKSDKHLFSGLPR
jgi:hypothetical protein